MKAKGKSNLPALGVLEERAAQAFIEIKVRARDFSDAPRDVHPLDDVEAKEFHFFKIYQFFERWAALIDQDDIDKNVANGYMSSYKPWYQSTFIDRWHAIEDDEYIEASLHNILTKVFGARFDA